MIDGKMVDIIQEDSGSFCHYCKATRKEANDITRIMQGFQIEKIDLRRDEGDLG